MLLLFQVAYCTQEFLLLVFEVLIIESFDRLAEDQVEKGLSSGNYAMAAAPIRRAMKRKQLTPGPETHRGNPMPVDSKVNIYAGGGKLKIKDKAVYIEHVKGYLGLGEISIIIAVACPHRAETYILSR